jgi:hypothetical protein
MDELNTYRTGVGIPAVQAGVTGVFFCGVVAGFMWVTGTKAPGVFMLAGGFFIAFVAWLVLLRHWLELVNNREGFQPVRYEVIDSEPEPEPYQPETVRVNLLQERNGGYIEGKFIDLPCQPEQLRLVAGSVVAGGSLSETAWCGSNKPFTKAGFHQLRDELIKRGWLAWRNIQAPAQGVTVTHVGRRVFQHIAWGTPYPTNEEQE